jgi:hypothetical protein
MSFKANLFAANDNPLLTSPPPTPIASVVVPQGKGFGDEPPLLSWKGRLFQFVQGSDFKFGGEATPAYVEVAPVAVE